MLSILTCSRLYRQSETAGPPAWAVETMQSCLVGVRVRVMVRVGIRVRVKVSGQG